MQIYLKNFNLKKIATPSRSILNNGYKTLTFYSDRLNASSHYAPLHQEWKDSVCGYNKEFVKNSTTRNIVANKTIQAYFNMVSSEPKFRKKKRARTIVRGVSRPRFLVAESDVKQTNDKTVFTVYVFMRENITRLKQFFKKSKFLARPGFKNFKYAINSYNPLIGYYKKAYGLFIENKKERIWERNQLKRTFGKVMIMAKRRNRKKTRNGINRTLKETIPYTQIVKKVRLKVSRKKKTKPVINKSWTFNQYFLSWISLVILFRKRSKHFKKIYNIVFYRWILCLFKLQIKLLKEKTKRKKKQQRIIRFRISKIVGFITKNRKTKKKLKRPIWRTKSLSFVKIKKGKSKVNKYQKVHRFTKVLVYNCLNNLFKYKSEKEYNSHILNLRCHFNENYQEKLKDAFLKKELLVLNSLSISYFNKVKFTEMTPYLKTLLNNVFNKKVELNLVNLKYSHLNSEIMLKSIVSRIMNQKTNAKRILSKHLRSSRVAKMNYRTKLLNENKPVKNKAKYRLDLYKGYNSSEILGLLNSNHHGTMFNNYTKNLLISSNENKSVYNNKSKATKDKKILKETRKLYLESNLDAIKYKWITGVRLEARGRLSKKYGADRARSILKYRGNLKNLDYLQNFHKNLPNTIFLRNQNATNVQYSYKSSERHIGTFGIKGWISSN